jgi:hypothetical protein
MELMARSCLIRRLLHPERQALCQIIYDMIMDSLGHADTHLSSHLAILAAGAKRTGKVAAKAKILAELKFPVEMESRAKSLLGAC